MKTQINDDVYSNITLLKEISEVCIRSTAFKTTKTAKMYCFWQRIPHFRQLLQQKKIYSECYCYSVLYKVYMHVL